MDNEELESIDLSFTSDEELSQEKLRQFERALDHSYRMIRTGLEVTRRNLAGTPNERIKVSISAANSAANFTLDMLEKRGYAVVLDRQAGAAMLLPWLLAGCELLNTIK